MAALLGPDFEPVIASLPPGVNAPGGRSGARGVHTSRTIMLEELSWLPDAVPGEAPRRRESFREEERLPWLWRAGELTGGRVNDVHFAIPHEHEARIRAKAGQR